MKPKSDKTEESSSCGMPDGSCRNYRPTERLDILPEKSGSNCTRANDVGLEYQTDDNRGRPDIIGPTQIRKFDTVYYTAITLPKDRNMQFNFAMKELFVNIRKPNTTSVPYTESEMLVKLLNSRSRRIVINELIRAFRYIDARPSYGINRSRPLALAMGGPTTAGRASAFHYLPINREEDYKDILEDIATTAQIIGTNDWWFDLSVRETDDEMYTKIFRDKCDKGFYAFFIDKVPFFKIKGTDGGAEIDGFYEVGTALQASDPIAAIKTLLALMRTHILTMAGSAANTAMEIDMTDYGTQANVKHYFGPVCVPFINEVWTDMQERMEGKLWPTARKVSDLGVWKKRIQAAVPLLIQMRYLVQTKSEIDTSTGTVTNEFEENFTLTGTHNYPAYTDPGFAMFCEKDECASSDERNSQSFFIVPALYKDTALSDQGIAFRTVTLMENRGYVMIDARSTIEADNNTHDVVFDSTSWSHCLAIDNNVANWYMATLQSRHVVMPLLTRPDYDPSADNLKSIKYFRMQHDEHTGWYTKRIIRVIQANESQKLWLTEAMFPPMQCEAGSPSDIEKIYEKTGN